nr:immunoglobulin light chain junction region [Macaca mulatta]MOW35024.1 immunoglobulin light chain junction region [Macaca mulatta]
CQQGYNAPYRF